MRRWQWPRSLGGRVMVVLVAAVVLVHLGSMYLYRESALDAANHSHLQQIAGRIVEARRSIAPVPAETRDAIAHQMSSASLTLHWSALPLADEASGQDPDLQGLRHQLAELMAGPGDREIRLEYRDRLPAAEAHAIVGAVALPDGSSLNFSVPLFVGMESGFHGTLLSTSAMAIGVAIVALLLMRSLTSPLRKLVDAANAIGRGPEIAVPESGPDEVRRLAEAFNAMQRRIKALIADRTQALAAVSHDLRTPITRLRLRAAFVDRGAQAAVDADLDEMEAMIGATLAYLRGEVEPETPRMVDLSALLSTLVDAASDAGLCAIFSGPRQVSMLMRRLAVKRALSNLIDNALTYGGSARVSLMDTGSAVQINVDDEGPGIPEAELERVFEPFHRLEASRSRRTGGVGLGLATARQAILRERGTIRLVNRRGGGLRAEVVIPKRSAEASAHVDRAAPASTDEPV